MSLSGPPNDAPKGTKPLKVVVIHNWGLQGLHIAPAFHPAWRVWDTCLCLPQIHVPSGILGPGGIVSWRGWDSAP